MERRKKPSFLLWVDVVRQPDGTMDMLNRIYLLKNTDYGLYYTKLDMNLNPSELSTPSLTIVDS